MDFGELFRRIVAVAGLRKPQVHRGLLVALGVLGALCVLATITRASAIPLIPLAGLAIAGYGAWRARTVTTDRQLVGCVALYAIAVSVSLWSMSYLARTLL